MGWECSTRRSCEKCVGVIKHEGKNYSEDLGVDGKLILEWILGN